MIPKRTAGETQLTRLGNGRANKKVFGVFYTPEYIVRFIVHSTLGRLCAGKFPGQVGPIRVLDPACGTGAFLIGAYRFLLDWHQAWYAQDTRAARRGRIYRGHDGQWYLTRAEKQRILVDSIYGLDIDAEAVEAARRKLLSTACEHVRPAYATRAPGRAVSSAEVGKRPHANVKHGNALLGADFSAPDPQCPVPRFAWQAEFPEVMQSGGFDVVIGNPPYGAALSDAERRYLARAFPIATTDTAALLMLQAYRLTRRGGWNGFIVPKPFTYSSNWAPLRALFLEELRALADAGKAWREVKLEQVVYTLRKGEPCTRYLSLARNDREFVRRGYISKEACATFGFYPNGLSKQELALGRKIGSIGASLGDFATNVRGAMLQGRLSRRGAVRAIGGKQVQPFHLHGQKGFLHRSASLPPQALVTPGSILVQNIVAHIAHPVEHIEIIGSVVPKNQAGGLAILDTVNQLSNHSHLSSHYLLALLSSRLVNWYVYRFIFARAIRTLHFDGPVSRRVPILDLNLTKRGERICHEQLVGLAKRAASVSGRLEAGTEGSEKVQLRQRINALRREIDQRVYELYGLTPVEILVVNRAAPDFVPNREKQR